MTTTDIISGYERFLLIYKGTVSISSATGMFIYYELLSESTELGIWWELHFEWKKTPIYLQIETLKIKGVL